MTLNIKTLSIMTLSIMELSITKPSLIISIMTLGINVECDYAKNIVIPK